MMQFMFFSLTDPPLLAGLTLSALGLAIVVSRLCNFASND
jgi:type IV secretory pathway VirB3-like protein